MRALSERERGTVPSVLVKFDTRSTAVGTRSASDRSESPFLRIMTKHLYCLKSLFAPFLFLLYFQFVSSRVIILPSKLEN